MNILFLDEWVPFPLDSGKKLRTFNLIRHLSKKHHITYLCYHNEKSYENKELKNVKFVIVEDNRTKKGSIIYFFKIFLNLFKRIPFSAEYTYLKEMQKKFDELINNNNFDLIICEWTPYAHYFNKINHPKKVLMSHNVEYQQWERMYEKSKNPLKRILFKNQWNSMKWFEDKYLKIFHTIVAVSYLDKKLIQKMSPNVNVVVVENGVDIKYFHPLNFTGEKNIIYTASMDAFVNQEAVIYFCKKIFPLLKKQMPYIKFYIVGRNPNKAVQNLEQIVGVTVTGSVDDIRSYVACSSVFVVPLLAGGGTRLKIIEAMSMGIPIVSTSVGAEGLEVKHNEHILKTDDENEFVEYVIECFENQNLRDKLITNSFKIVNEIYSWEVIGKKLNNYCENL